MFGKLTSKVGFTAAPQRPPAEGKRKRDESTASHENKETQTSSPRASKKKKKPARSINFEDSTPPAKKRARIVIDEEVSPVVDAQSSKKVKHKESNRKKRKKRKPSKPRNAADPHATQNSSSESPELKQKAKPGPSIQLKSIVAADQSESKPKLSQVERREEQLRITMQMERYFAAYKSFSQPLGFELPPLPHEKLNLNPTTRTGPIHSTIKHIAQGVQKLVRKGKKRKLDEENDDKKKGPKQKMQKISNDDEEPEDEEEEGETANGSAQPQKEDMFGTFITLLLDERKKLGDECFSITWSVSDIVSLSAQRRFERQLDQPMRGHWRGLMDTPRALKVAEDEAKRGAMKISQMCSFYFWMLTNKAMRRHPVIAQKSYYIKKCYDSGKSILELSRELDVPPVAAFRGMLAARGWPKNKIKTALDHYSTYDEFSKRDRKQFRKAEKYDLVTRSNNDHQQEQSIEFETKIERFLQQHNIPFRRQEELTEEQKKLFNTARSTPDFLLLSGVLINGKRVGWIEAKNFYGAELRFPAVTVREQLVGYVKKWGPGAVVFSLGFCAELKLPDTVTVLDASIL